MNKERLLNVAKALRESRTPDDFHMDSYSNDCGTPACALGHYAARTDLQSSFRLIAEDDVIIEDVSGDIVHYDSRAVREHFDLDHRNASRLFDAGGCDYAETPTAAADFIEAFVRGDR